MSTYTPHETVHSSWTWRGFGFRHDVIDCDYMERWSLSTPLGQIRLHHILRSDNDRHFHDHPFDFVSIILRGGYIEYRPDERPRLFLPKDFLYRRAEQLHYLKLIGTRTAWTLVLAGPRRRAWGFMTADGWVDARDYGEWLRRHQKPSAVPVDEKAKGDCER